jgi:hypothetical protein
MITTQNVHVGYMVHVPKVYIFAHWECLMRWLCSGSCYKVFTTCFIILLNRITPGRNLSPLRVDRSLSLDLSSDRRRALDLGSRQLSLDLSKLFSAVGNSSMNGRLIFQEVEQRAPVIDKASEPFYQNGVLRTNCIDCLDRTNVAQYAYGLEALGRQLQAVGLTDVPKLDPDCGVAACLMDMYQNMGDSLALQYGGSEAHNYVRPCSPFSRNTTIP